MPHHVLLDDDVHTTLTSLAAAQGISVRTLLRRFGGLPDAPERVKGRPHRLAEWIADGRLRPGQRIFMRQRQAVVRPDGNLMVIGLGLYGSLSAAAKDITGHSSRGPACWRTAQGIRLMDL